MKTDFITVSQLIEQGEASIQTGPFGTQLKASDYVPEGTPVINVRNVGFGDVRKNDLEYIDERKTEKLSEHVLRTGDIVFGRKGAVERHGLIAENEDGWVQGSDCLRLRLSGKTIDRKFASFYFRTHAHQRWMEALCSFGATMASLNQDIVKRISIPLFDNTIQKKIAAILTAYDDLIENNKRRIALLEKMAEEIYREWFVRMRFPGHQKTKFIKGIPEGWTEEKLDDLCKTIKRGVSPKYDDESEELVINQRCIRDGNIDLSVARGHKTSVPKEKYVQYGDALINSTGVGTLGRVSIMEYEPTKLSCDSHVTICRANPKKVSPHYLAHTVRSLQPYFEYMATGSTGQVELSRSLIAGIKIKVPTPELMESFAAQVSPVWKMKQQLHRSITNLTQTRDLLLPRLISGKLSVEDLDIQFPPSMVETQPVASTSKRSA